MQKIAFIDFDGVIVDIQDLYEAVHRVCTHKFGGINKRNYWSRRRSGVSEAQIAAEDGVPRYRLEDYLAMRRSMLSEQTNNMPIINGSSELHLANHIFDRTYILSAKTGCQDIIEQYIYRLNTTIKCIVRSSNTEPAHIWKANRINELEYDHSVIVGDSETDYKAAKLAGIEFIGVDTGLHSIDYLRSIGARTLFNDLREVLEYFL